MKWINRDLIIGPYYCLCKTEKEFKKALKHLHIKKKERPDFLKTTHCNATVHFFEADGKLSSVVCLGNTEGIEPSEIVGLLIHEAVHIWQEFKESIGEKYPSREFEAYSIQTIAQRLIEAYDE